MIRYLPALILIPLLSACSSVPEAPPAATVTPAPQTTPAPQPGLRGQLLGVASGAEVELALLAVDLRGRPRQLLGQVRLRGDGEPLPFHLPITEDAPAGGQRLELRGRVSQSGRLVQRLPARTIAELSDQDLGALHLVPAP
ncbi:YbaY family lipoprotein [Pseudomonas sp. NCHU5208]|uniref:YbaY family lipoprotein n=1 Tax=unclassified Pseudomonas TaxID=196821 RepID=UPI003F9772C4